MTSPVLTPAQERDRLMKDWHYVMADERGCRVIERILARCGTYQTVIPGPKEPGNQIYVNAGRQELGQEIVREILAHVPEDWHRFYKDRIIDLMAVKKEKENA
jgi:hypothetical protein